jgi:hypothetical protein
MFKAGSMYVINEKLHFNNFYNVLEQLNWLTVAEKYELFSLRFIYKNIFNHSNLTNSFSKFFVKSDSTLNLRNSDNFILPSLNEYGKASFTYQFINAWNHLPNSMKITKQLNEFDQELRKLLLIHRNNNHIYTKTRIVSQRIRL